MKKEDKYLLFKDLCARLPYGVKCKLSANGESLVEDLQLGGLSQFLYGRLDVFPYLRPISSITEEEKEDLLNYVVGKEGAINFEVCNDGHIRGVGMVWVNFQPNTTSRYIGWLLKNHFDIYDLIPKGLALKAPKDMYNEIKEEKK